MTRQTEIRRLRKMPSVTIAGLSALAISIAIGLANAPASHAQAQPTTPLSFEVASVKPSRPGESLSLHMIRPLPGGQTYIATNAPLRLMIKVMYKIADSQIIGAPKWIDTEFYDVQAKAATPSSLDQLHEMFQTLLADRFKLKFHRAMQESQAYMLTVDKSGAKLKVSDSQEPFDVPIKPTGSGRFVGTRVPMSYLSLFLSQSLSFPVVDQTGLGGYYDFILDWMPMDFSKHEVPEPRGSSIPGWSETPLTPTAEGPNLIETLRKQLGLKLESRKAPVEVFVIDRVERPSEN